MQSSAKGETRQSMGIFVLCLLLMIPGSATYSRAGNESKTLTEEEKIIHVLNRLGFGPRPGDIERVQPWDWKPISNSSSIPREFPIL